MQSRKPILIAGPTASGKSALALALAEHYGGVIINADSMQVYRELAILTARPVAAELARAPHRLYGHVPASEAYSAGRWATDVAAALAQARAQGRRPIIVGGTGLYFSALLEGLSPIPPVPDGVRAHWRGEARRLGADALHADLARRDPEMASRLAPGDRQRVTRALEVLAATGRSLAAWQRAPGQPVLDATACVRLLVVPERAELQRRCDARFDAMMAAGGLAEIAAFRDLRLDAALPAMRALGVAALAAHLDGGLDLATAIEAAKRETRQYAKRQLTWLRRHMIAWNNVFEQLSESKIDRIISMIDDVD